MAHSSNTQPLVLHPDRGFDADPSVREVARDLYDGTRDLPIVSPHGHVDPRVFASDEPFADPSSLFITPDHYVARMLYSQGVSLEALGVPRRDEATVEADPRRIWRTFADHYHLFLGTPSAFWIDHALHEVFGVRVRLTNSTAMQVYDQIAERLKSAEFRPRALFERFGIEVLATTDAADDPLLQHQAIGASGWSGRVIPTFRPDALFQIASPAWQGSLDALGRACGRPIADYGSFVDALQSRRIWFRSMGATATDHGVTEPFTTALSSTEVERLFGRGMTGAATAADQRLFQGQMLMEMARMSVEDGLVMQLHAGALRDHNQLIADRFGADRGGDIPIAVEFTRNLQPLLNAFGNESNFTLVLFTLDESVYSRELAPLAGHYPAVRLGPPWWFHDSLHGMERFREQTIESAGIWNTAGFNDDTRAFCSIPARHDLSRRIDANCLARLVSRHMIDLPNARLMARALAYGLARATYRLEN